MIFHLEIINKNAATQEKIKQMHIAGSFKCDYIRNVDRVKKNKKNKKIVRKKNNKLTILISLTSAVKETTKQR